MRPSSGWGKLGGDPRHAIDVRPLSPNIGAEISGVDLAVPLSADVVAAIRDA